jgi:hypothetical protein
MIKTKYGDVTANPLVSVARKAASDMVRFAGELAYPRWRVHACSKVSTRHRLAVASLAS